MRFTNNQLKDFKIVDICKLKQGNQYDLKQQFTEEKSDLKRFIRIIDYTQKTNDIRYVYSNGSENYVDCTDVVVVRYGASAGYVGRGINGIIANNLFTIRPINSALLNKSYLYHYLNAPVIQKQLNNTQSSGMPALNFQTINNLHILLPEYQEQRQIAVFLDKIDERIQTQIKIIGDYNSLKKGIIQHIFNVNYEFPNVHLKAVLKEISQKNKNRDNIDVLSVSNSLGFIKQSEQFEDREIASADTSNYKIVNKNEYAYNPARINVGSIARLQSCDCGIVSPMYTVFKTDISKISYEYFDLFLQSSTFQKQLNQKLEGSVRQCLTFASMQNILIELPPLEMQIEISEKMKFIDSKIKIESDYLNLLKTEKEYLLKNMFV